jgi:secondary thiamine-phosphate synthase enzyme
MSKRSTITIREQPVVDVASDRGAFRVRSESFTVQSSTRVEIVDLTDRVAPMVRRLGVDAGLAHLSVLHTTCAVFINEYQAALAGDMTQVLERLAAREAGWLHDNPAHSDCERLNADAHLRAMFLGHGVTLQVSGGELVLGQWQRVLFAELDGPRPRTLRLLAMGGA